MNQLAFAVGALSGLGCAAVAFLLWRVLRPTAPAWLKSYDATHMAAFEQWPTTALVLDPGSAKIIAMNPAGLRSFGYTLGEVRGLRFTDLFSVEGVDPRALVKRVQESNPRTPWRCARPARTAARATSRHTAIRCSSTTSPCWPWRCTT